MRRFTIISFLAFFAFLVPFQEIAFAEGGIAWGPNGVPICTAKGNQQKVKMVPDGSGGAIIVWEDSRDGQPDIYAQRIDKDGNPHPGWDPNGVVVFTGSLSQQNPVIINDGSGGAIIVWEDYRNVTTAADIYAQRINAAGILEWNANGVCVSSGPIINMINPDIVNDGYGGAIITWQETNYGHPIFNPCPKDKV